MKLALLVLSSVCWIPVLGICLPYLLIRWSESCLFADLSVGLLSMSELSV